jgi:hypothetical protein
MHAFSVFSDVILELIEVITTFSIFAILHASEVDGFGEVVVGLVFEAFEFDLLAFEGFWGAFAEG